MTAENSTVTDESTGGEHTLFEFLYDEMDVSRIEFNIGILFNADGDAIASPDDDDGGSTTSRLMDRLRTDVRDSGLIPESRIDKTDDDLHVSFTIVDPAESDDAATAGADTHPGSANRTDVSSSGRTIEFDLRARYGDAHLSDLYGIEQDQLTVDIGDIASAAETDDLWLTFSVVVHELQLLDIDGENGAETVRNTFLTNDELGAELDTFYRDCHSFHPDIDGRDDLDAKFESIVDQTSAAVADDIKPPAECKAEQYTRDLVRIVVLYHILSRPVFLEQFPDPVAPISGGDDDAQDPLATAHHSFIESLFNPEDEEEDIRKKQNIFRCVRSLTRYTESGDHVPSSDSDSIDWRAAPTASEIKHVLNIESPTSMLRSMGGGNDKYDPGLVEELSDTKRFAVSVAVARRMDGFMNTLTDAEHNRWDRKHHSFLEKFPVSSMETDGTAAEDPETAVLIGARATLEKYIYDDSSSPERVSKRQRVVEAVRKRTMYQNKDSTDSIDPDDEIDWDDAPTSAEIGEEFDRKPTHILKSLARGQRDGYGGIIETCEENERFAMPAPIAARIDQPIPEEDRIISPPE